MSRARDGLAELDALDGVFAALAHPSRRHILVVLQARGGRVRAGDDRFLEAWRSRGEILGKKAGDGDGPAMPVGCPVARGAVCRMPASGFASAICTRRRMHSPLITLSASSTIM